MTGAAGAPYGPVAKIDSQSRGLTVTVTWASSMSLSPLSQGRTANDLEWLQITDRPPPEQSSPYHKKIRICLIPVSEIGQQAPICNPDLYLLE